jgi:hypothetical protein
MNNKKPKDIVEYQDWLKQAHKIAISSRERNHYESSVTKIKTAFETSDFWTGLKTNLREIHDEYRLSTGYLLLREFNPVLVTKPFDSFLVKTFRKNVLENKKWPNEPENGWILPHNWLSRINDTVRTLLEVKYLDGVEFLAHRIGIYSENHQVKCEKHLEARWEGYYAAHLYIRQDVEIPQITWDTQIANVAVEIQITTQLQEAIRQLFHGYYEEKRKKEKQETAWQWDYKSDEFTANYLGHILHFVEGMIVEIRDKQRQEEKMT